jgi:LuxR family maltose regulon positive regulatory protein
VIGTKPAVTKFIRPPLPRTMIRRPDLLSRLDAALQFPCTLVAGSPGVGKTVLLASWAAQRPEAQCAWLSCDRWDRDELRVWTSIAAAFAAVEPGSVSDALDLLAEGPDDIEDVVASLVNELALWSRPTWLILDDLHVVAPSALGGLATFVERLPSTAHVAIGTRVDPVLPIQRWRARGQLAEIRDADLRLEAEDVRTFMRHYGLDLSSEDVQALTKRTEGWLAGVQLAALSLQHDPGDPSTFVERLAGTERVVADFLIEEVLDQQSVEMVEFLQATSVVDEFDVELANFLLGNEDSAHLLRQAMSSGLFLVPLGGDPSRYRYHQLFREFLHAQLSGDDPSRAKALHSRAGEWYEKTGSYVPAVDHYVQARDLNRAFAILHDHVAHEWFAGRSANLDTWLGRLSDEDLRAHRGRMLDYAIALGLAGRVEEEGWWLAQASSAEGDKDVDFEIRLAAADAHWHGMRGEPGAALAFERDVFSRLTPGSDFVLDQFPLISARAHLYLEDQVSCLASCDIALRHADPATHAVLLGIKSGALCELGQLHEARAAANTALEAARQRGVEHHVGLFEALLTFGTLHLEADQLDEAERSIEEALRRCEKIRPPFELLALVERARLFRARGELVEGLGILDRARTALAAGSESPLNQRADALEARIRIDLGEPERAADLALALPRSPTRCHLEARALLGQGQADRADVTLNRLDVASLGVRPAIEHTVLRADVRRQLGLRYDDDLRRLIELGRPQGFVLSVLDAPSGLRDEMVDFLRHLARDDYADSLLAVADRIAAHDTVSTSTRDSQLSTREQGVLRFLQTRLTTREIAGELFISMNTLKTHLKSIYRKLDASSRSDAVARGRAAGFL